MRSSEKNQAKTARKTQLSLHEAQLPELEWSTPTQEGEGDTTEERQQATSKYNTTTSTHVQTIPT